MVEQPFGRLFGILCRPLDSVEADICAVFLNPGAVRHTGPNRLWVETSRRWASRGMPALRVDLEGIGESDGDEEPFRSVEAFYVSKFERQVVAVLDALEAQGVASRFVLVGLCAGGYWAYRTALQDPRVRRVVLTNAGALSWRQGLTSEREARKFDRIFESRWRRRLLSGGVSFTQLLIFLRSLLRRAALLPQRVWGLFKRRHGGAVGISFAAEFERLRRLETKLTMAFSADEPLADELRSVGILSRLGEWPDIDIETLPGEDHTLRPISAQIAVASLLDRELDRALVDGSAGLSQRSDRGSRATDRGHGTAG